MLTWIDKDDLDRFARMNGASDKLPRLVANLILATSQVPDVIRFLSDAAGRVRGFDGVLLSPGAAPFVPAGRSYWEFGCEQDYASKARKDVGSRTRLVPDPGERGEATLVLVTPWHYDNPRKPLHRFVAELAKGHGWKEVRFYDGAQLRHWLDMAPAVAARWARLEMQAMPQGVLSTEEFWQEYASRFHPPLQEDVLLAGRKRQADELVQRLARLVPDRIPVGADSPDEAAAFAVAAIRKADPAARLVLEARTIVVTTAQAARDLRDSRLVFIPMRTGLETGGLLVQQGPTVLPSGRRDPTAGGLQLGRSPRHDFAQALETMSFSHTRACQLASECGRSVTVLARRIPGAGMARPPWSASTGLVAALLAGGWDAANEHDRAVLAKLAGVADYPAWQATVQPYLVEDDPALENEGTVWKVRAPVDAFVMLGIYIGTSDFARLRAVADDVFSDRDANAGKTAAELFGAPPGIKHSSWLRIGLATTLLLTATLAEAAAISAALAPEGGAEQWVDGVVAGIPGFASDATLLASLSEVLPILAEAAPRPFVRVLDGLVRTTPDAVASLFVEHVRFISPESDHVWLLWALETVAWDRALLAQVCTLLARLAALDPGGKLMNRPSRSLQQILLAWYPHTDASLQARLGAIRAVMRTDETVGLELAVGLLPEHHGFSDMTRRPILREAGRYDGGVPNNEVQATYREASAQVARLAAGRDLDRWCTLIEHIPRLAPEDQATVTANLDALLASLPQPDREPLWRKAHDLVAKHAQFPDADWTMKGEALAALEDVVRRWISDDPMTVASLLFGDVSYAHDMMVGTPEVQREREAAAKAALRRLLAEEGHQGLFRLVEKTDSGWVVGRQVGALFSAGGVMTLCREALDQRSREVSSLVVALSGHRAAVDLQEWTGLIEVEAEAGQDAAHIATLLLGLPDGPQTWDLVQHLGPSVDEAFWKVKQPYYVTGDDASVVGRAIRKFLGIGRAGAALTVLQGQRRVAPTLIFQVLDGTVTELNAKKVGDASTLSYRIEQVFEGLRRRSDVDRRQLALREYVFLPLLTGPGRPQRDLAIFELMATDPTDFIRFLATVFRSASAPDRQEVDKNRWRAAYDVLQAFRTVPGEVDGGVDGVVLSGWVKEALRQAGEVGLADLGAQYVGKVLAHAPPDKGDGAWPATPLRDLIEEVALDDLERGISMERFAMRGVYSKGIYDGGHAEREFARVNRSWAEACAGWPRTAAMLGQIAGEWERQAEREDIEARQRLMRD